MPDCLESIFFARKPTLSQPLLGQTVLVVEDSRYVSEALRLLSMRSGARVRRADSMASAQRHLATYRPSAIIVDPGLPDGNGLDLIRNITASGDDTMVRLVLSGDPGRREEAMEAGAHVFLDKPVESLALFQQAILDHLPAAAQPEGPRPVPTDLMRPDRLALSEDLTLVARAMDKGLAPGEASYYAAFLSGLARASGDTEIGALSGRLTALAGDGARVAPATLSPLRAELRDMIGQPSIV